MKKLPEGSHSMHEERKGFEKVGTGDKNKRGGMKPHASSHLDASRQSRAAHAGNLTKQGLTFSPGSGHTFSPDEEIEGSDELSEAGIQVPYKTSYRTSLHSQEGGQRTSDSKVAELMATGRLPVRVSRVSAKLQGRVAKLTNWTEIPIKKLVDFCDAETTRPSEPRSFLCPICLEEYYKDMQNLSDEGLMELNDKMEKGHIPTTVVLLSKCKNHFFHKKCVETLAGEKEGLKCPLCDAVYGRLTGDMPEGEMVVRHRSFACAGYSDYTTISVTYKFPPGVSNGKKYEGTEREAFLPNCPEGQEVLGLLRKAFDRKLLFTIGKSETTGIYPAIIWNGVHHKTNIMRGAAYHGYPDPGYLARVKEELAAKGVYATTD